MSDLKSKRQMLARLKKLSAQLAKTRDDLRDLRDEVDVQFEGADRALDDLMQCIDTLSETN